MAGPVYHDDEFANGPGKFPSYFNDKFFAYEWMRDWIYLVQMDKDGNYVGAERFMPNSKFAHPMDMTFDHQGSLYVLDYGMNWFVQNEDATLSRIDYVAGNRNPVVNFETSTKLGASPLLVNFDATKSMDHDGDQLTYSWDFGNGQKATGTKPKVTFKKPGNYEVKLEVKDTKGNVSSKMTNIKVGNDEPKVGIKTIGNKTFYFENSPIEYEVSVQDKEDGTLAAFVCI
jgi:cytochrome c